MQNVLILRILKKKVKKTFNIYFFKVFIENCPCTESDWECDYGY